MMSKSFRLIIIYLKKSSIEDGLNPLFGNRAEDFLIYPSDVEKVLGKRERPDRVYGLQITALFERLISRLPQPPLSQRLTLSPFKEEGQRLIYPFLILEAKSAKGNDHFGDIELQTAFAIREMLRIQSELASAAQMGPDWISGPLVWFLSYKGSMWRVHAGTVLSINNVQHYVSIIV